MDAEEVILVNSDVVPADVVVREPPPPGRPYLKGCQNASRASLSAGLFASLEQDGPLDPDNDNRPVDPDSHSDEPQLSKTVDRRVSGAVGGKARPGLGTSCRRRWYQEGGNTT